MAIKFLSYSNVILCLSFALHQLYSVLLQTHYHQIHHQTRTIHEQILDNISPMAVSCPAAFGELKIMLGRWRLRLKQVVNWLPSVLQGDIQVWCISNLPKPVGLSPYRHGIVLDFHESLTNTKCGLQVICKQEHSQRPCPRTILVLCTALCTNGLYTESIFKQDAPSELTYYLLGAMQEGMPLLTVLALVPCILIQLSADHLLELLLRFWIALNKASLSIVLILLYTLLHTMQNADCYRYDSTETLLLHTYMHRRTSMTVWLLTRMTYLLSADKLS